MNEKPITGNPTIDAALRSGSPLSIPDDGRFVRIDTSDLISRAAVVKMMRDRADDEEWSDHAAIVRDCAKWIEEMP